MNLSLFEINKQCIGSEIKEKARVKMEKTIIIIKKHNICIHSGRYIDIRL
jgi:hypothetical protein